MGETPTLNFRRTVCLDARLAFFACLSVFFFFASEKFRQ